MSTQPTYTLHKPARKHYLRRWTFVSGIDQLYEADLVDMLSLSRANDGYKYLLTVICCFSRFAFVIPLKGKSAMDVKNAFVRLIEHDAGRLLRKPKYLFTDHGGEFLNGLVQKYLTDQDIIHYTTQNYDTKAAIVERFNRTLKEKIYRYLTFSNSQRYIEILPNIVDAYNHTYHRSIGMAPVDVTPKNEKTVAKRLYGNANLTAIEPISKRYKFEVGDRVRVSKEKNIFRKGYLPQWSIEVYVVSKRKPTLPVPTYELEDLLGEKLEGSFYAEELQKINSSADGDSELYKIEKILKTRQTPAGKTEYLVRWLGYPPKFDSWVDAITDI